MNWTMMLQVKGILLFISVVFVSQQVEALNECERGVKRPHPSQENAYQLFSRSNHLKRWIDHECRRFTIFDPRKCACVEKTAEAFVSGDSRRHKNNFRPYTDNDKSQRESEEDDYVPISSEEMDSSEENEDDEDEDNCKMHRPSRESPSHFERWTDGQWVKENCNFPFYTGLVWSQVRCRCEWGTNRTAPIAVEDSETPAICLMMLHVTFNDGEIRDEGRGVWINIKNKLGAEAIADNTAVGGYAGSFRGASMVIPYFKSNVIGPIFHIGFQFLLCPGNPDTDIFLVHNDCKESKDGPSLVVSYQSWKQRIVLAMRTTESEGPGQVYCTIKNPGPQRSWLKVDIRYQDHVLEVMANDELCATGERFQGPMVTNNCPLTLMGESFCGKIDEVIITRGCTEEHAIS